MQVTATDHKEVLEAKQAERDRHKEVLLNTRQAVMTLQEQREQASTTAATSQAAIRDKADAAKVERER